MFYISIYKLLTKSTQKNAIVVGNVIIILFGVFFRGSPGSYLFWPAGPPEVLVNLNPMVGCLNRPKTFGAAIKRIKLQCYTSFRNQRDFKKSI